MVAGEAPQGPAAPQRHRHVAVNVDAVGGTVDHVLLQHAEPGPHAAEWRTEHVDDTGAGEGHGTPWHAVGPVGRFASRA